MSAPADVLDLLAGRHVLALPHGTDLLTLARAWFPAAAWTRDPAAPAAVAPRMTGARFRGLAVATAPATVTLALDATTTLDGPHPLDTATARALNLPPRDTDAYGLPADSPAQVTSWAVAVARRTAGAVLPAARDQVVVPDPDALVDLTLWSAVPLAAAAATGLVRRALPGSRLTVDAPDVVGFTVTAAYPYDGAVEVRCARSRDVPAVLTTLDWRTHGPFGYQVAWRPPDPLELEVAHPSTLHVVARQRVAPGIARVVDALLRTVEGVVVDPGGFVVAPQEVAARAQAR